ncbi:acyltransferase [Spirosoma sp. KNUC1025]|uniref:acyltransferase family protein n=1 Tax=Spirosoma sp. KNUC1025 TaxID=2894082 RepID=UPI00386BA6C6|nr:acyltransferase [Spirosoma sp. KNUC1025]
MKLQQLTFTRFLAAILIVLYHLPSQTLHNLPGFGLVLQKMPALVSYFFLLSGFILVISTASGTGAFNRISRRQFWINRFARIYPLYLFAFLATSFLDYFTNTILLPWGLVTYIPEVTLTHAWVSAWVPTSNYPSWSISVEVVFYLLFPSLLNWLISKRSSGIIFFACLSWVVNQLIYAYCFNDGMPANVCLYFPLLHLSTFIGGVCTGILTVRHWQILNTRHSANIILGIFLIFLALAMYLIGIQHPLMNYYHDGLLAPLFIALILFLATQHGALARWLSHPKFIYLGEISYGIYLLQIPVGKALSVINSHYLHLKPWQYAPVYISALLLISSFCYELIETPARSFIRRWFSPAIQVKQPLEQERVTA